MSAFALGPIYCTLLLLNASIQRQPSSDLTASVARGKPLYATYCLTCHMEQGQGLEGIYPPLAGSGNLMANNKRAIQLILYGSAGAGSAKGKTYSQPMPGVNLPDSTVSDILNYVRNAFGNKGAMVKPATVKAARTQRDN